MPYDFVGMVRYVDLLIFQLQVPQDERTPQIVEDCLRSLRDLLNQEVQAECQEQILALDALRSAIEQFPFDLDSGQKLLPPLPKYSSVEAERFKETLSLLRTTAANSTSNSPASSIDEFLRRSGLAVEDGLILSGTDGFTRDEGWVLAGWESSMWPKFQSIEAAAQWVEAAICDCDFSIAYMSNCNASRENHQGSEYVRDAYRFVRFYERELRVSGPIQPNGPFSYQSAIEELRKIRQWLWTLQSDTDTEPNASQKNMKPKRSTQKGEAQAKLISALTLHHQYSDGSCLNLEPLGNNELARLADVSADSASRFLNKEYGDDDGQNGLNRYKAACRDPGRLADSLKTLNGEFAADHLYGRIPPGEDERREDD